MIFPRRERPRAFVYQAIIEVKPTAEGGPKAALESPVWSFRATVAHEQASFEAGYGVGIMTESGGALRPGARAEQVALWFFAPPLGSSVPPGTALQLWIPDRIVGSGVLLGFDRSVELE